MKAQLIARLKTLGDRVDALSLRERGLVFAGVMVVLYLVAVNLVFSPLRVEQAAVEKELAAKREQLLTMDNQIQALLRAHGDDPNAGNRAKIEALKKDVAQLDGSVDQMTAGVVSPKEMTRLIERMLAENQGLQLVKLESLPALPINDTAKAENAATTPPVIALAPMDIAVYKHGMRIELKGSYFEIVNYLKALEKSPWKVFWGEVSLETEKYPISKVTLVIYTLSRHPNWIGV